MIKSYDKDKIDLADIVDEMMGNIQDDQIRSFIDHVHHILQGDDE